MSSPHARINAKSSPNGLKPLAIVDGWAINLANPDETVRAAIAAVEQGIGFSLVTLNLDHLVKLRHNHAFRHAYQSARFVTADGAPVAWLARRSAKHITRTTGADLVVPLAQAAADHNIPVFCFGTSNDALAKAATYLSAHTDGKLDIAGTLSPPQGFDPMSAEADAALDTIAASGAKLCFLALGAPKQEILAARAVDRGLDIGFVSIGAALDFLAGSQIRAPKFFQNYGLEWAWRLMTNPIRLAPRYASCAVLLAGLVLRDLSGMTRSFPPGNSIA